MNVMEKYYRFINVPSGDLRISITDQCNMRCEYCHNEGQQNQNRYMALDTIEFLVDNALRFGVHKVRLTGGEPLLHKDIYKICKLLKNKKDINLLGINTNGFCSQKLLEIAQAHLVDQVVIGIDSFNNPVSKRSPVGPAPSDVLNTILELKKITNLIVEVDSVFGGDLKDTADLVGWCISNDVVIKILEEANSNVNPKDFDELIPYFKNLYNLELGKDVHFNENYLFSSSSGKKKIIFYHSHCNRRDCEPCKKMHLRVSVNGYAKPCMLRNDTECYLLDHFDEALSEAISYLGVPPKNDN